VNDIVQLTSSDFEEAIDHLNRAFAFSPGAGEFPSLLPKIYRPEQMPWNYAVKTEAGIRAMVGVFPMTLHVGRKTLKLAGIGGVSTHPEARGQGLMHRLMTHCVEVMKDGNYDISCLGGLRGRYGKFGYEVGGLRYLFQFLRQNLIQDTAHSKPLRLRSLSEGDDESISAAKTLHDRGTVHVNRPASDFYAVCRSWINRPFGAFDEEDRLAGYLVADHNENIVVELCARDPETALQIIRTWMDTENAGTVQVQVKPSDLELARRLGESAQGIQVVQSYQWKVFNWAKTVDAFLALREESAPRAPGTLVLGLNDRPNLKLSISEGSATCEETDDTPHFTCTEQQGIRLLFGPQPPEAVMPLPAEAAMLKAWCPFPLSWSNVDGV
jgi:predicted N-acetyltransferase YhbS